MEQLLAEKDAEIKRLQSEIEKLREIIANEEYIKLRFEVEKLHGIIAEKDYTIKHLQFFANAFSPGAVRSIVFTVLCLDADRSCSLFCAWTLELEEGIYIHHQYRRCVNLFLKNIFQHIPKRESPCYFVSTG